VLGVDDPSLGEPLAQVLMKLGVKRGMVVYGTDKLDEVSVAAPTHICEFKEGWFKSYDVEPSQFGLSGGTHEDIKGGTPQQNAEITRAILRGEEKGAKRDAVLLNAGAALCVGGKADTFADGVKLAAELIDSGKAYETLEKVIEVSNR
jgi:anthranilate phosphoribosyltransferase